MHALITDRPCLAVCTFRPDRYDLLSRSFDDKLVVVLNDALTI